VLLVGLTLFTVASVVTACAPNAGVLIGSRILQSIGGCAAGARPGGGCGRRPPDKAAGQLAMLTLVMSLVPALAAAVAGLHSPPMSTGGRATSLVRRMAADVVSHGC